MDKEVKRLVDDLKSQGWRTEETKKGRVMAYAPDGVGKVLIDTTIADRRAMRNTIGRLRHHGYRPKG